MLPLPGVTPCPSPHFPVLQVQAKWPVLRGAVQIPPGPHPLLRYRPVAGVAGQGLDPSFCSSHLCCCSRQRSCRLRERPPQCPVEKGPALLWRFPWCLGWCLCPEASRAGVCRPICHRSIHLRPLRGLCKLWAGSKGRPKWVGQGTVAGPCCSWSCYPSRLLPSAARATSSRLHSRDPRSSPPPSCPQSSHPLLWDVPEAMLLASPHSTGRALPGSHPGPTPVCVPKAIWKPPALPSPAPAMLPLQAWECLSSYH